MNQQTWALIAACRELLLEHAQMNAELRKVGRGRTVDGAHPDCPVQMVRHAIDVLQVQEEE